MAIGCGGRAYEVPEASISSIVMGSKYVPVWVDYRFDDAERAAVTQAFADWNTVLAGHIDLHIVSYDFDDWPEVLRHIYDTGEGIVVYDQPTCRGFYGGWVDIVGGNFIRSCQFSPGILRVLIMHEIGHILGLTHVDSPNSLMYPTVNPNMCIDALTAEQLNKLRGWDVQPRC